VRRDEDSARVLSSKLASVYYPRRPLWLRAVNMGGAVLQRLGLSFGQFDVTRLMAAACQHTGLHDFGTIPFQESLQLRLYSCEHEAQLNLCGQMVAQHDTRPAPKTSTRRITILWNNSA
jgi:hypothetical protein